MITPIGNLREAVVAKTEDVASVGSKELLDALREIEWVMDILTTHREHWKLTKSLTTLPSDSQCAILIKALKAASESIKASNARADLPPR